MRSPQAREWAEWLRELRGGGASGSGSGSDATAESWAGPTYASGAQVVAVPAPGAYHSGVSRAVSAVGTQRLSGRRNPYHVTFGHGKRFGPRLYDSEAADDEDWKGQESPGPGSYTGAAPNPWLRSTGSWRAPPPRPASSADSGRLGPSLPSGTGRHVGPGSYDSSAALALGRDRPPLSGTVRAWGAPMGSADRSADALVTRPYYVPAPHTPTVTPGVGSYDGAALPWPGRQHLSTLRNAAAAPISPPASRSAARDTVAPGPAGEGGTATLLGADSSFGEQLQSTRPSPARPTIGSGPKWDDVSIHAIYPDRPR